MAASETTVPLFRWWGAHELEAGALLTLQLGALTLWVTRQEREWRIGAERTADLLLSGAKLHTSAPERASDGDQSEWERFAQGETSARIELKPGLMERPFMVRPYAKLHLLPGQQVVVYVTTPVVVRISEEGDHVPMVQVPVMRPSETWRGTNTMEGMVCYAGRTHARLNEKSLELRESRAVTAVTLNNPGRDPYWIEQIYVPVHRLAVYEDPASGALHTDSITVTRERGEVHSEQVEVHAGAPKQGAIRVSEPREAQQGASVLRMLHQFWEAGA